MLKRLAQAKCKRAFKILRALMSSSWRLAVIESLALAVSKALMSQEVRIQRLTFWRTSALLTPLSNLLLQHDQLYNITVVMISGPWRNSKLNLHFTKQLSNTAQRTFLHCTRLTLHSCTVDILANACRHKCAPAAANLLSWRRGEM